MTSALPEVLEKLDTPLPPIKPDPREFFIEVCERYGLMESFIRDHAPALLRDAGDGWRSIESAPQHKEVLVYIENAGVLLAQQTHLADVFASDAEIEALADDGMSEEEMFRICWWAYLPNGVVRMEDDCGNPTRWRPLPAPPAEGE